MHENDEVEVTDEPGQPPPAAPAPEGTTSPLSPAQKAAATRRANVAAQVLAQQHAERISRLSAEVNRLTARRRAWQTKEERARDQLRRALSLWQQELGNGTGDYTP